MYHIFSDIVSIYHIIIVTPQQFNREGGGPLILLFEEESIAVLPSSRRS